jgi:hypothetical protein
MSHHHSREVREAGRGGLGRGYRAVSSSQRLPLSLVVSRVAVVILTVAPVRETPTSVASNS